MSRSRREFLADVGRGALVAGLGAGLAAEIGGPIAWAAEPSRLTFGDLEPLVALLQETRPDRIVPVVVEKIKGGLALDRLTAAAALANARTFGGEDYVGFHTLMALSPAYRMSREMPDDRRALPLLKVLYRNANRITEFGGPAKEVLKPVEPEEPCNPQAAGPLVRRQVRGGNIDTAEAFLAYSARSSADDALNTLLPTLHDGAEVHRVVLVSRAWDLLGLVGRERAHTMLRQSLHYCAKGEKHGATYFADLRALLPKVMSQYRLTQKKPGRYRPDDAWIDWLARTVFSGTPEQAAEAAAAALSEGIDPDAVGEAISLATNQLVLRDEGRPEKWASPGKPAGSVHGDSIGVHACDSVNAWRLLARAAEPANAFACLVLGAWQTAKDRGARGEEFLKWQPYPRPAAREKFAKSENPEQLLRDAEGAIRGNDQAAAAAAVDRIGEVGGSAAPVFDLLRKYAVSEDGALHAEKFYGTTCEEFAAARPAFRWRYLTALARVTASAFGRPAPGMDEACKLLKVT
jgi:hypothetical protein